MAITALDIIVTSMVVVNIYLTIFWLNVLWLKKVRPQAKNGKLPAVSLVVPAYNESKTISKTLRSLLNLDYPKNKLEIIVVNDGSTDDTVDIVKRFAHRGVVLLNKPRGGKGSALNFALKRARGELFGVVDADSLVGKSSLKFIARHFTDEKVGGVTSTIKAQNRRGLLERMQHFEYLAASFFRKLFYAMNTLYITPGVLSVYRKDVIKSLGGFDEKNHTEDLEIALRLRDSFYKIEMEPASITRTVVPAGLASFARQRLRWNRGHLYNVLSKYRHIMFNPKYGLMGTFQFPLHFVVPTMTIFALALLGFYAYVSAADLLWRAAVAQETLGIFHFPTLKELVLGINLKNFAIAALFLIGVIIYHMSHLHTREKWRYFGSFILFLFVYQPILAALWVIAIVQEITSRAKRGRITWAVNRG